MELFHPNEGVLRVGVGKPRPRERFALDVMSQVVRSSCPALVVCYGNCERSVVAQSCHFFVNSPSSSRWLVSMFAMKEGCMPLDVEVCQQQCDIRRDLCTSITRSSNPECLGRISYLELLATVLCQCRLVLLSKASHRGDWNLLLCEDRRGKRAEYPLGHLMLGLRFIPG